MDKLKEIRKSKKIRRVLELESIKQYIIENHNWMDDNQYFDIDYDTFFEPVLRIKNVYGMIDSIMLCTWIEENCNLHKCSTEDEFIITEWKMAN